MNLIELDRALKQLRLGGMAAVLETRLRLSCSDSLTILGHSSFIFRDRILLAQYNLEILLSWPR